MSCIHRSHKLMDWISTYDSSSLISLEPIREDDNETKWWLLRVIGTISTPSYHFSISKFSTLIMLSLQIPKNVIDIISLSHKSRMALWSKIWLFKDLWRIRLARCRFNCSTSAITGSTNSFSTNTKIMLMGTQTFLHKVLVVFPPSPKTVREVN